MSIGAPTPPSTPPQRPVPARLASQSLDSGGSGENDRRVREAQKEAKGKIDEITYQTELARIDGEKSIERLEDSYEKQYTHLSANQEAALEKLRSKGYEQVRDLQRAQQAEARRIRREGEQQVADLQEHYRNATWTKVNRGDEELKEIQGQQGRRMDYQHQSAKLEWEQAQSNHETQVKNLREDQEARLQHVDAEYKAEYDKRRNAAREASEHNDKKFNETFEKRTKEYNETLDNLQNRASKRLKEVREDTSQKLSAYGSRQRDPFYKLRTIDARIHEAHDGYVVTARIPKHEQQNVSVGLKGNNIVISGTRRNEERLDLGKGHTRGTASFQTYTESFPLSWPVESKELTREFDGETLIVTVPKKNEHAFTAPKGKLQPTKLRVESPRFPENLPVDDSKSRAKNKEEEDDLPPPKGQPVGWKPGGTLG